MNSYSQVVARSKSSRLSDQSRAGRPESPKDAQLEIEYYRLKVDELQLTLELEEQNRTLGEARRRKALEREDADLTERAIEGYRATVQYLYGLLLKSQREVSSLQRKLEEERGRRGLEDSAGVTCREAEKVIDMLTLEQNRKQDELQRLEGELKKVRGALVEAEEVCGERQATIEAYEELVVEKEQEINQLLETVKEVMGRAHAAAESAKLWRIRALEIATETAKSTAEADGEPGHRESLLMSSSEIVAVSHCTAVERLAMETVIEKMCLTSEQRAALTSLKALSLLRRVLRRAKVMSLCLARWLCGMPQSQGSYLCSLLARTADASAGTIRELAGQGVERCISVASTKGAADLLLSAEGELDDVVHHMAVGTVASLPYDDLVVSVQNFLTKLQSACSAMFPDFNPLAVAGVAGSAVLAARLVAVAAAAHLDNHHDEEVERLLRPCEMKIRQALSAGGDTMSFRPAAVEAHEEGRIRALEKSVFASWSGDKVGSTGPKGLAEGLEDAAALISRLPPEGELPEVTSNEAEGSLVADIVDLLHKESGRYGDLQQKLEGVQTEAGSLREELKVSKGNADSLRASLGTLEQRLIQTSQKDEAAKARESELERLRAEIEYYRRVERRQLRAQLGSCQKELDSAGAKEASLRRKIKQFEEAEKLRAERERATGDFGGSRHLLALQMRMLSEQNARLRARLVRAYMKPLLAEVGPPGIVLN